MRRIGLKTAVTVQDREGPETAPSQVTVSLPSPCAGACGDSTPGWRPRAAPGLSPLASCVRGAEDRRGGRSRVCVKARTPGWTGPEHTPPACLHDGRRQESCLCSEGTLRLPAKTDRWANTLDVVELRFCSQETRNVGAASKSHPGRAGQGIVGRTAVAVSVIS